MLGLLYPAVLGSVIVATAIRIASPNWTGDSSYLERLSLGALLLFFFCASYVNSYDAREYQWPTFTLDFIEVALMFMGFWYLRLLSSSDEQPQIVNAYRTLLALVPLQEVWRSIAKPPERWY